LNLTGKLECSEKKPYFSATFSTKNPTWIGLGFSLGLHSDKKLFIYNHKHLYNDRLKLRAAFDSMRKISSKKQQGQVYTDNNPMNYFHYSRDVNLLDLINKQLSFLNS